MITPWLGPTDVSSALEQVREQAGTWQSHGAWSEEGKTRWHMVLALALPPLPGVNARFALGDQAWRGLWARVNGHPSLWAQARAGREGLNPWFLLPLGPLEEEQRLAYWAQWLDQLAQAFSHLSPAQTRKSCPQSELAARLSGPSWALLSGRARAGDMLKHSDFA